MKNNLKNGDNAQTAEHQQKNDSNTTNIGEIEDGQVCPISYKVFLMEFQVDDQENPITKVGSRVKIFNDPDPFYARQDALIFAAGLESIIKNEHNYGGLVFNSENDMVRRRFRNCNGYYIHVWLEDAEQEHILIASCFFDKPLSEKLPYSESENRHLESRGYLTDKVILVSEDGDPCNSINSLANLVDFEENDFFIEPFTRIYDKYF